MRIPNPTNPDVPDSGRRPEPLEILKFIVTMIEPSGAAQVLRAVTVQMYIYLLLLFRACAPIAEFLQSSSWAVFHQPARPDFW